MSGPVYDSYGEEVTRSDIEYDERLRGICMECGEEVTAITVDYGIGVYEYGSAREVDVKLAQVSPCCEADVVDEDEYEEKVDQSDDVEPDQRN